MKAFLASVCVVLAFSEAIAGVPAKRSATDKVHMGFSSGRSQGAAYFATNEPSGNYVIAADIGKDGKLTLREAISTGGLGAHGDSGGTPGPDPLFTQGAVKASASGKVLATVNAGSNTISLFSISRSNPTSLELIGAPVGSGGEFPVSLDINAAGNHVCVLNGGEVNGVSCFSVDKTKGLVPISQTNRRLNINQTTPANGPAGSASHVVFSEDGKQLVASIKGVPPTPGFLAAWDVAEDGSLSEEFQKITPADGGLLPFSLTVIPGKNAFLATDPGIGFDIFDLSGSDKSSAVAIEGQGATCWSSFSPKTGNFYLTDLATSKVTEISIDDNLAGSIVKQYDQGAGSATIDNDIASIGSNDFLYVLKPNVTAINVVNLAGPGQAKTIQTLDLARPARAAGLKISAANLVGMTTYVRT